MKINKDIIAKLGPCKDRFDNFKNEYPSFDGDLKDFISLDNISYDDKVWVVIRLFTKAQNVRWTIACADSVLHIFEKEYPNDKRPRQALEAATAWVNDPSEENMIKTEAAARVVDISNISAYAAAAAAYAAYVTYSFDNSVAYAAFAVSGAYAVSASATAAAQKQQQELNLLFLLEAE